MPIFGLGHVVVACVRGHTTLIFRFIIMMILIHTNNAKACFNVSSRFSTTYCSTGGSASQAALKTTYAMQITYYKHFIRVAT